MVTTKTAPRKSVTKPTKAPRFILLDVDKGWRRMIDVKGVVVCRRGQEISEVLSRDTSDSLWVSSGPAMSDELLRVLSGVVAESSIVRRRRGSLLTLVAPRPRTIPFLRELFRNLIGEAPGFKWLPSDQLCEVIAGGTEAGRDVFIGGVCNTEVGLLTLVRGNFDRVTVPLSMFRPSATSKPDFRRFRLDDYGHTICFGPYEASADHILYEADAEYRTIANAKRRTEERSFGASLRRLRIQRGVAQDGFRGITAKTIGRIERGEVAKPHGATIQKIARTLGVLPEDIETY